MTRLRRTPEHETKEAQSFKKLIEHTIHHFEMNGLKKEIVTQLKEALDELSLYFEIPHLEEEWYETRDSDNLERALLVLSIVVHIRNAKVPELEQKKFQGSFESLYPEWSRVDSDQNKERDEQFEVGRMVGFSNTATIMTLCYKFHEQLFADKEFIESICPDTAEQDELSTPEGFLEYLYKLTPKKSPFSFKEIVETIMYRVAEFGEEVTNAEDKKTIFEFSLNLTQDERQFLGKWLEKKEVNNKGYLPLGIASRFPFKASIYFSPLHRKGFTKEHERLHLRNSGFRLGNLGVGLDEGMTELLAEEEVFSKKGLIRRLDSQLHHKMQDRVLLDRSSKNFIKRLMSFFAHVPRDYSLIKHQIYEEEVAFLIRLFKNHPKLREIFEKRYSKQRMESVTPFAVEVMNTLGLEFYLSLFLMEPYFEEGDDTSLVFISAQRLADKL